MDARKARLMDSTRFRKMSWNRMSTGNFRPRPLASSITSVRSTEAPASCKGVATTWPASLMSKYFAPQRWTLYKLRAVWRSQGCRASFGLLIFHHSNERTIGRCPQNSIRAMKKVLALIRFYICPRFCFLGRVRKTSLSTLAAYCDRLLHTDRIKDYDGAVNGLQVENSGAVTRIAAAVDASLANVKLAVAAKADLLIVHHGLFWSPTHP